MNIGIILQPNISNGISNKSSSPFTLGWKLINQSSNWSIYYYSAYLQPHRDAGMAVDCCCSLTGYFRDRIVVQSLTYFDPVLTRQEAAGEVAHIPQQKLLLHSLTNDVLVWTTRIPEHTVCEMYLSAADGYFSNQLIWQLYFLTKDSVKSNRPLHFLDAKATFSNLQPTNSWNPKWYFIYRNFRQRKMQLLIFEKMDAETILRMASTTINDDQNWC